VSKRREATKLYTAAQVAEKTGLSKHAVLKAIERNQLHAELLGAQYVITEGDMQTWLSTRRKPGRPKSL